MDDVQARLLEMLDHYEIRKTLSEYNNGCDRVNEDRMASVYAEESWDDHGATKLPGAEFAAVMAARVAVNSESMFHLLGQSLIHVAGGEAGAETYFLASSRARRDDGTPICNQLAGRFIDTLVREKGTWKIRKRVVVRDWTQTVVVESEWEDSLALTPGQRSNDDPSFAALGFSHGGPPSRAATV
jgi:hypothetical protein